MQCKCGGMMYVNQVVGHRFRRCGGCGRVSLRAGAVSIRDAFGADTRDMYEGDRRGRGGAGRRRMTAIAEALGRRTR